MKNNLILVSILFLMLISCNEHIKKSSGIYQVDYNYIDSVIYDNKTLDTTLLQEKINYYSDFYLHLNSDKSFFFTKPFYNEKDTIIGSWEVHDDPLAFTIILNGNNDSYFSYIGMCERLDCYTDIRVPNQKRIFLPIKKIKNEFPELSN